MQCIHVKHQSCPLPGPNYWRTTFTKKTSSWHTKQTCFMKRDIFFLLISMREAFMEEITTERLKNFDLYLVVFCSLLLRNVTAAEQLIGHFDLVQQKRHYGLKFTFWPCKDVYLLSTKAYNAQKSSWLLKYVIFFGQQLWQLPEHLQ